jgi:hypothetical protein
VGIEGNFAGGRKQRVRDQSGGGESLQVPAHAQVEGEMVGDADRVLGEGGVVVAVGMGRGWAEVLQIVFRDGMSVGAQGRERQSGFHGFEVKGSTLMTSKRYSPLCWLGKKS